MGFGTMGYQMCHSDVCEPPSPTPIASGGIVPLIVSSVRIRSPISHPTANCCPHSFARKLRTIGRNPYSNGSPSNPNPVPIPTNTIIQSLIEIHFLMDSVVPVRPETPKGVDTQSAAALKN